MVSRSTLLAFVVVVTACTKPVLAADELIDRFFETCVGTLPDFSTIGEALEGTAYKPAGDNWWTGGPEQSAFNLAETPDRLVCQMAVVGDHTERFSEALKDKLEDRYPGRFEQKQYQGRKLYLVSTERGLTILEVIPPLGASTFLVANARRE